METKALRGLPWAVMSYAVTKVVALLVTVVLARLLQPSDFGLVALATLAIGTLMIFNDLGLGATLVVRQDLGRRAQGTLLTLMLLMAVVVALVVAALSGVAASALGEPRLQGLLLVLAISVALSGPAWFFDAQLQRELEFRLRFIARSIESGVYAVVAIGLAVAGAGVWSLVIAQVAGILTSVVVAFLLVPYRVRPAFDREVARDTLRTSRGFLTQGGLSYVQDNVDYLAVGKLLGATALGYYSMAYRMAEVPYYAVADPVAKVTFPSFARMRRRGEDPIPSFLTALRSVALVASPVGIVLSAAAEPFVRTVFGDRWLPMVAPLSVLGLWSAIRPVQFTLMWLLNSFERASLAGIIGIGALIVQLPFLYVAVTHGTITTVAWVMVGNLALLLVALALAVRQLEHVTLARQWHALRPVVLACGPTWVAAASVAHVAGESVPLLSLLLSVAAGGLAYVGVVSLLAPGTVRFVARKLRAMRARAGAPADVTSGP
ncbi:MAG: lipopolysaccharide biosynthesis protein [Solirubrobacteraceae bacterium]